MAGLPLFHVDAFTDRPFGGNPAAVCLLPAERPEEWMQGIAGEMNLSETAFLVPQDTGYLLRWFTPTLEVKLCGHATLAAAHVLYSTGRANPDAPIVFQTQSGPLTATLSDGLIQLDFPGDPIREVAPPANLLEALGIQPQFVGQGRFDYLLELDSAEAVRGVHPDFRQLRALPIRGVIVTARSDDPRFDCISRFFAPGAGVDEDPVTGSAHCALACYWGDRLGKATLTGFQASRRGGIVQMHRQGERVQLAGQAVLVAQGEVLI